MRFASINIPYSRISDRQLIRDFLHGKPLPRIQKKEKGQPKKERKGK